MNKEQKKAQSLAQQVRDWRFLVSKGLVKATLAEENILEVLASASRLGIENEVRELLREQ